MAILAYQALIVFSLIVVRVFARQHLMTACVVWSGFTVFNLFFWPLILVQLALIWVSYAVLKPADEAQETSGAQSAPLNNAPPAPAAIQSAATQPTRFAPVQKADAIDEGQTFTGTANKISADFKSFADRTKAVQEVTSRLRMNIYMEQLAIEGYLETARSRLELEARFATDPKYRELYEKHSARLSSALATETPKNDKEKLLSEYAVPDFSPPPRHADKDIADAIEQRVCEMHQQREAFITKLKQTLDREPDLRRLFCKAIETSNYSKLLVAELQARLHLPKPTAEVLSSSPTQPRTNRRATFGSVFSIPTQPRTSAREQVANLGAQAVAASTLHRPHIQVQAAERGIRYLIHFTRLANLTSILHHGLLSAHAAHQRGLLPLTNDKLRLDGHRDAVSLSIGFPNAAMFYKYRQLHPQERWVVLLLRPEILWTHDCAYCLHNAADRRIRSHSWSELTSGEAFQSMFAEAPDGAPTRTAQRLDLSDPTDVQAEVLVRGDIDPSMLVEIVFEHQIDLSNHHLEKFEVQSDLLKHQLKLQSEHPDALEAHRYPTDGYRARVQVQGSDFFASRGKSVRVS